MLTVLEPFPPPYRDGSRPGVSRHLSQLPPAYALQVCLSLKGYHCSLYIFWNRPEHHLPRSAERRRSPTTADDDGLRDLVPPACCVSDGQPTASQRSSALDVTPSMTLEVEYRSSGRNLLAPPTQEAWDWSYSHEFPWCLPEKSTQSPPVLQLDSGSEHPHHQASFFFLDVSLCTGLRLVNPPSGGPALDEWLSGSTSWL
jgi:hypothetical protein